MIFKKLFFVFLLSFVAAPAFAQTQIPAWLARDLNRKAAWLPRNIIQFGVTKAYQMRMAELPALIQQNITQSNIPFWMVALIPENAAAPGNDTYQQLSGMTSLNGNPSQSPIAQRAEQLLMFIGSARLPTLGDSRTGLSLGAEGCSAAMSRYILAELKLEFPRELASMPDALTDSQNSASMIALFQQAARAGAPWLSYQDVPFARLQVSNVAPGSIMFGQKPGGTHTFGWTRIESSWNCSYDTMMAIGNTGLPKFGDRMIIAQEYMVDDGSRNCPYNTHGPLNSTDEVLDSSGHPILSSDGTNVYFVEHADFIIISFR